MIGAQCKSFYIYYIILVLGSYNMPEVSTNDKQYSTIHIGTYTSSICGKVGHFKVKMY